MKIAQVGTGSVKIPPKDYGGIERYIFEIARRLAHSGQAVTILDVKDSPIEPSSETKDGINIIRLKTRRGSQPNTKARLFLWQYFRSKLELLGFALQISRHLKRNPYEIIHIHVTLIGLALVFLNRKLRYNIVYTVHSPIWAMETPGALDRLAIKMDCILMSRVSRVVAQSESMRSRIIARSGIPVDRINVIPSGVDTSIYHPGAIDIAVVRKYGLEGKTTILFTGRIVPYKGVIYLAKAAYIIINLLGYRDVVFLLAGPLAQHGLDSVEHATYIQELSAFIKNEHLEEVVKLTGAVSQEDLIELFRACDIFVLPSLAESSPAATLQAMSCAKPVVATHVGGITDQIKEGWNGFLVPPRDETALADKIRYLLAHPSERSRMGCNGRQLAEQEFDWDSVSQRLASVYYKGLK